MGISVVLAEDNALLREGLVRLLATEKDLTVVDACDDLPSLLDSVDRHSPDVVVTDIRMPPTGTDEGIVAATRLRTSHPRTGVVVLSQYVEPAYALALLEAGSDGRAYLLKDRVSDVGQLVGAIRAVAKGQAVIDPKVVEHLVTARQRARESPLRHLTPREAEVLGLIAQGKSNAAIASHLYLSERAIEKHINSILAKLNLSSEPMVNRRVAAVLLYLSDRGPTD